MVALFVALSDPETLNSHSPTKLMIALIFPLIGLGLMLVGGWYAVQQWRQSTGSLVERLRFTTTVVIGLVFAWSLSEWNLLGWHM